MKLFQRLSSAVFKFFQIITAYLPSLSKRKVRRKNHLIGLEGKAEYCKSVCFLHIIAIGHNATQNYKIIIS